jgi:D-beta-D-heptose 7-phosphate kinase/D-beta-D-heptose 1-phosphate adenosyltransferase
MDRLIERITNLGSPAVTLVGDFILDCYLYGDVERVSPEAPVPVLRSVKRTSSVGGAGNVAAAVTALGATVSCVGVLGKDSGGDELVRLLMGVGARTSSLLRMGDRPTAVKTRYVGLAQHRHPQQMLRVDDETTAPLGEAVHNTLRAALRNETVSADIMVLEDYNKGVLTDANAPQLIADARSAGKRVVVDPACITDYRRYRGASLIKPNRYEASLASGIQIVDDESLHRAAVRLRDVTGAEAVLISLDREGSYLLAGNAGQLISHRRPRSVYDVTGAGDETLAVLAVAMASGSDLAEAAELANVAGGLEVERFGFSPVSRDEMVAELRLMIGLRGSKVLDRRALAKEISHRRAKGERVVFTNGCFDLLHMGHVTYLQQARELGHCLVVAINSDDSVRRLKGPARPIIGQAERASMLAALECVDYVTVFDEDTPIPLLQALRPDILVKGGTTDVVVGRELVESYGGRVQTLQAVDGLSTTEIINRIVGPAGQAKA